MEPGPFNDNPAREQSSQILEQLQDCYTKFVEIQQAAKKAHSRLSKERDLSSAQCERITGPLFQLDEPIQTLYALLQQQTLLPHEIRKQPHRISLTLSKIEEHMEVLKYHITSLASGGPGPSPQMSKVTSKDIIEAVSELEKYLSQCNETLSSIQEISSSPKPIVHTKDLVQPMKILVEPSDYKPDVVARPSSANVDSGKPLLLRFITLFMKLLKLICKAPQAILTLFISKNRSSTTLEESSAQLVWPTNPKNNRVLPEEFHSETYFKDLYQKLANFTEPHELEIICMHLDISDNLLQGRSHDERALSLVKLLRNRDRLSELEAELRILIPKRFPPPSD